MKRGPQGSHQLQNTFSEPFRAYIPNDLPPDPSLRLDLELQDLLERANRAIGRLDGVASMLPDIGTFLYLYVRKEAVLSSQIEGTQSSLSDLLQFESDGAPGAPIEDVVEVSNYVAALNHGIDRLRAGSPLTNRLLREVHGVLLSSGRGSRQQPGEFRASQNWIGGTRPGNATFIPPPREAVPTCMASLEKFLNDATDRYPTLLKAALAHVQFETIHPFLDGNGRVGRLLIPLLLCFEGALRQPLLYLSLYFKEHRSLYYDLLQEVRLVGDWERWLGFFLEGVAITADQGAELAHRLLNRFDEDSRLIAGRIRSPHSTMELHRLMQRRPILSSPAAALELRYTKPTVNAALQNLIDLGIVRETTGRRRNRLYAYEKYLAMLNEGIARHSLAAG